MEGRRADWSSSVFIRSPRAPNPGGFFLWTFALAPTCATGLGVSVGGAGFGSLFRAGEFSDAGANFIRFHWWTIPWCMTGATCNNLDATGTFSGKRKCGRKHRNRGQRVLLFLGALCLLAVGIYQKTPESSRLILGFLPIAAWPGPTAALIRQISYLS